MKKSVNGLYSILATKTAIACALGALSTAASPLHGQDQSRVERNVLFGMYSGLALLMDVHRPPNPNGVGVIFIHGRGWHEDTAWSAPPLKDGANYSAPIFEALVQAGVTVFSINHRAAPRFRYPAGVDDSRRAVQFVRHHADAFDVDPTRIATIGYSAGGHFAALLGVGDGQGTPDSTDEVARQSWKVNAVIAVSGPYDLTLLETRTGSTPSLVIFMGERPPWCDGAFCSAGIYKEASPIEHVSADDPPFLIIQGRSDLVISPEHGRRMEAALKRVSVDVTLVDLEGGHGPRFDPTLVVDWLLSRLREQ